MIFKIIQRKAIRLINIKFLLIGLLLSLIFLKLNFSLDDILTFVVASSLFIYLCIGLAYWINKYLKKDNLLLNIFILFFISGILYTAINIFVEHQVDIPILTNFLGNAIWFYALIVLISVVLVLIKFIINLIFSFVKKRADTIKLILAVTFFLTSIFIFYHPISMKNDAVKFYYQTVNPEAGMVYYEKQYKNTYKQAENYRTEIRKIVSEIDKYGQGEKSYEYLFTLFTGIKTRTDKLFIKRDQSLKQLVEIDKTSSKIKLPNNQKQFYEKRKLADENELNAFSIYKLTQEGSINGSIVIYGFWDLFNKTVNSIYSSNPNLKTVEHMAALEKKVNEFYSNDVKEIRSKKILSNDLLNQIEQGSGLMTKLFAYQRFVSTNPSPDSLKQKQQELFVKIQEQENSEQSNMNIYMNWVDYFVSPGFYLQDKEHQKSFNLFKDAYEYAKKQKMNAIFSVWSNDYPGYEKPQIEPITLKNSKEAVEGYYKIYENPMVRYIRIALNAYLQGDPQKTIPQASREKDEDENYIYGLDSFNKEYYKSKFVVILNDNFPYGGNQFTIMFQDKSDRFFAAWVYEKPDKSYELRGFSSAKKQKQEEIDKVNIEFKDFLMDKEHSM